MELYIYLIEIRVHIICYQFNFLDVNHRLLTDLNSVNYSDNILAEIRYLVIKIDILRRMTDA